MLEKVRTLSELGSELYQDIISVVVVCSVGVYIYVWEGGQRRTGSHCKYIPLDFNRCAKASLGGP